MAKKPAEPVRSTKSTSKGSTPKQEVVATATKTRLTLTVDEHLVDLLYRRRDETGRTLATLVLDARLAYHETVANSPSVEENRKRQVLGLSPIRATTTNRKRHLVLFVTEHERRLLEDAADDIAASSTSE